MTPPPQFMHMLKMVSYAVDVEQNMHRLLWKLLSDVFYNIVNVLLILHKLCLRNDDAIYMICSLKVGVALVNKLNLLQNLLNLQ